MSIEQMFTELPTVSNSLMSDIICAVQGYVSPSALGLSTQQTLSQVFSLFQSNIILFNAGNPNGSVAGSTYQFCWDTTNSTLYICTVSGTASTAVWIRADINDGYTTTATAAGTTTLTIFSTYWQFFTGSTTQTVVMPVASTLAAGMTWGIVNNSTGAVTIQSSGLNTITTLAAGQMALVTCILNSGTSAASWHASVASVGGGVASVTGTASQVLVNGTSGSAQTGALTLTTPQNIATTSSPTFAGLNLTGSTSGTLSLLATAITGTNTITFPAATGTVALTSQLPTPSALTKTDDTNVTLTLGGSPTVALLAATSLTLGWTGQLGLTRGGTNASLTASNGGIVYSTATALAILAGTATAGQMLQSGASTTPAWSTTTYPSTNAINTIMYASSANVLGSIAAANSSVLVTSSTGVPSMSGAMTNGQLIIGSTGATPTRATLTAGTNISITNGAGSITITGTGLAGFSWTTVTGTSQAMLSNNGYIANNAGLVTLTLPATSAVGDEIDIIGKGAGGWKVQCGGGQTVVVGSSTTTSGGSVASTNAKDAFYMICTVANTEWTVGSAPQTSGLTIA